MTRWEDVHLHLLWELTCTCTTMTQRRRCTESTIALVPLWQRGHDVLRVHLDLYHYDTEEMMFWEHTCTFTTLTQRRLCPEGTHVLVAMHCSQWNEIMIKLWTQNCTCRTMTQKKLCSEHRLAFVLILWHRGHVDQSTHMHLYHYYTGQMMLWEHTCTCTTMTQIVWCYEGTLPLLWNTCCLENRLEIVPLWLRGCCFECTFELVPLWHRRDDVIRTNLHLYHHATEEIMFWGHICTCTTRTHMRWCSKGPFALVTLWHRRDDILRAHLHLYHYDTE